MFEQKKLSSYIDGEVIKGIFIIASASKQTTKKGDPFWKIELKDEDGRIPAKIWNNCPDFPDSFPDLTREIFADVQGNVSSFNGQIQCVIERIHLVGEEENESLRKKFLEEAHSETSDLRKNQLRELEKLSEAILTNKAWKAFYQAVMSDEEISTLFPLASAARSFHHAHIGGLLEHTLSVAKLCMSLCDLYPELDRQCLFVAAVFHDIGKIREMRTSISTEYTDEGLLLGHIVEGLCLLNPFLEKSSLSENQILHLRHLITSHHGNLEYGSPKLPQTEEAYVLHFADDLDAKLNRCRALVSPDSDSIIHAGSSNFTAFHIPSAKPVEENQLTADVSEGKNATEDIPFSTEFGEESLSENIPPDYPDDIPSDFYEITPDTDISQEDELPPWDIAEYDIPKEKAVSENHPSLDQEKLPSAKKTKSKKTEGKSHTDGKGKEELKDKGSKKPASPLEPIQGSLF